MDNGECSYCNDCLIVLQANEWLDFCKMDNTLHVLLLSVLLVPLVTGVSSTGDSGEYFHFINVAFVFLFRSLLVLI